MNTNKMVRQAHHRGFTLLELLVVIAIIAILAVAVVLILNPAQLFAQARDSQRIDDLATLRSALALYSATSGGNLGGLATACYYFTTAVAPAANCGGRHAVSRASTPINSSAVTGAGWIPVNFGLVPGGSPLSVLPRDPRSSAAGNSTLFYSYVTDTVGVFELNADMESARYQSGGVDDVESNTRDGGNLDTIYEIGNDPGLDM